MYSTVFLLQQDNIHPKGKIYVYIACTQHICMAEIKNTISFTKDKHKFQQDGSPLNNKEINTSVQIL